MDGWVKKRDVMRRYDLTAHLYNMRYSEEQKAKYDVALEGVGNSAGLVLDAGCGTGLLFDYVANRAKVVVGLDISRRTLLAARECAKVFSNVHLVCADVDYMPFRDRLFSGVYAMTLIQNSPNALVTLHEITRVSKNGAVIVITGLKRVFSKKRFGDLIRNTTLRLDKLRDESNLKCYIATCTKTLHSKTP